jgi:cation diffusion facilitator family transporter
MSKIRYVRDHQLDPARYRLYQRAIWIAIVGNSLLAVVKGRTAWTSGSTAMLATAVESFTDVLYSIFMAWGLRLSQQPADESHPQGHARVEPVVSTVIALMMGMAGWEVLHQAIDRLFGEPVAFEWGLPTIVLVGGGLVKVIMYLLVRRLARSVQSPAINASARDNLTDVFSSGVALFGVLAANWLHPLADPLAGALVSLWIFRNVRDILVENVGYLIGRSAEQELVDQVHAITCGMNGVLGVHQIIADYVGPQLRVDMHVDIAADIPFYAAHDIHSAVQKAVESLAEVDQAFIHLEPIHEQGDGTCV